MRQHRVRFLSRLLDEQFRIPGTRYRIGLDGILGLIPGVGDVAGMLLSTYILYKAIKLGDRGVFSYAWWPISVLIPWLGLFPLLAMFLTLPGRRINVT